jgi:hypothetical protein
MKSIFFEKILKQDEDKRIVEITFIKDETMFEFVLRNVELFHINGMKNNLNFKPETGF